MQIDVPHAGILFFNDFVDIACTARDAELELDAGKLRSKAGLELFSQFGAGGDGHDHFALLVLPIRAYVPIPS